MVVLCNMMSSGIFHSAMICSFFLPAVTYLLFVFFSVGLACSVFNLFSYGFGVCGIWYLFLPFFCHWVINETLFSFCFFVGLTKPGFRLCMYFFRFISQVWFTRLYFFSPLSQHILHLISSPFHFPPFFLHLRGLLGRELRSQTYRQCVV